MNGKWHEALARKGAAVRLAELEREARELKAWLGEGEGSVVRSTPPSPKPSSGSSKDPSAKRQTRANGKWKYTKARREHLKTLHAAQKAWRERQWAESQARMKAEEQARFEEAAREEMQVEEARQMEEEGKEPEAW